MTEINYRKQTQLWHGSRLESTSVSEDEQKNKAQGWIDTLLKQREDAKGYKFEWVASFESDYIRKLVVTIPDSPPQATEYVLVTFIDGAIPLKGITVNEDN